jgi:hypothetical protein
MGRQRMEADSDRKGAAADPALSSAMMEARKLGALHGVVLYGNVHHVTPLLAALESKHGPDSPLAKPTPAQINEGAKALGDAVYDEYKKANPAASREDMLRAGPAAIAPPCP